MTKVLFETLPIAAPLKKALAKKGYQEATTVQAQAIPPLLEWRDLIAQAPTGTGKTVAFGVPLIEHIDPESKRIQALVLTPTRELAMQICTEMRALAMFTPGVKILSIYGGQPIQRQIYDLKRRPQIIVATPGRLLDHLDRRSIRLSQVETIVLDEADRMVDMGFYQDVTDIINMMPKRRNLALLSATMSDEIKTIEETYQNEAAHIFVPQTKEDRPQIDQFSLRAAGAQKLHLISGLIKEKEFHKAIIFCNTKRRVELVMEELREQGQRVGCLHGDIKQSAREKILANFRDQRIDILVATDVASRGLDIDDVDVIFNYDVPNEFDYYVHRIGRTGRAKKSGAAYTLIANNQERRQLAEIARRTKSEITALDQGDPAPERSRNFKKKPAPYRGKRKYPPRKKAAAKPAQ